LLRSECRWEAPGRFGKVDEVAGLGALHDGEQRLRACRMTANNVCGPAGGRSTAAVWVTHFCQPPVRCTGTVVIQPAGRRAQVQLDGATGRVVRDRPPE
jgi:hypothetical protein